jgi:ribosome-binding protein aMBF1 (putative translation factor)
MTCTICGIGIAYRVRISDVAMYHCIYCGSDFLTPDQAKVYSRKVKKEKAVSSSGESTNSNEACAVIPSS